MCSFASPSKLTPVHLLHVCLPNFWRHTILLAPLYPLRLQHLRTRIRQNAVPNRRPLADHRICPFSTSKQLSRSPLILVRLRRFDVAGPCSLAWTEPGTPFPERGVACCHELVSPQRWVSSSQSRNPSCPAPSDGFSYLSRTFPG